MKNEIGRNILFSVCVDNVVEVCYGVALGFLYLLVFKPLFQCLMDFIKDKFYGSLNE